MFDAYVAVSPNLWWDNGRTLHQAEQFLSSHPDLKKTLFISLASEGNTDNPMSNSYAEFERYLAANAPKGLTWRSVRYPDEDHGSTTAVEIATKTGDSNLGSFRQHVDRVTAEMKTAATKDDAAK